MEGSACLGSKAADIPVLLTAKVYLQFLPLSDINMNGKHAGNILYFNYFIWI